MASKRLGETKGPFIVWVFFTLYFTIPTLFGGSSSGTFPQNVTVSLVLGLPKYVQERVRRIAEEKAIVPRTFKVQFTQELPAIVGADMKVYGPFKIGDVAELPRENVNVLLKQNIARLFSTDVSVTARIDICAKRGDVGPVQSYFSLGEAVWRAGSPFGDVRTKEHVLRNLSSDVHQR